MNNLLPYLPLCLLPYKVEYSVGELNCKKCDKKIRSGVLKIAIMMQSEEDDCQYPDWYHRRCFFETHLPKTEAAFDGFAKLRYADQVGIKERMGTAEQPLVKRAVKKRKTEPPKLTDFSIETTKSVRDSCYDCKQLFVVPEVRIMHVVYNTDLTDDRSEFGGQATWYHVICFVRLRSALGWLQSGESLPGFKRLSNADKVMVERHIPIVRRDFKAFVQESPDEDGNELEKLIEKQNREYFDIYDKIVKNLPKKHQLEIIKLNGQFIPEAKSEIIHQLTDMLYFGNLEPCNKCYGNYVFNNSTYSCATFRQWGRCGTDTRAPKRTEPYVPYSVQRKHPFLSDCAKTIRTRALHQFRLTDECGVDLIETPYRKPPLFNMEFALIGKLNVTKSEIENAVKKAGGKVATGIHEKLVAVISNEVGISKMGAKMTLAKTHNIPVVSEDFLTNIETCDPFVCIASHCLSDWGENPHLRVEQQEDVKSRRETTFYTKTIPDKITYTLNDDAESDLVDVESGLKGAAHIYCGELNGKQTKFMAVLGLVDIELNKNSYYRMQLLESNDCKSYSLFESWGRISTLIGSKRLTNYDSLDDARIKFCSVFMEKVGNQFGTFTYFKQTGKYFHLRVDFEIAKRVPKTYIESKLDERIYDLMKMIFDMKHMKEAISYDLNLKQMPLGKLDDLEIRDAMSVLKRIEHLITGNGTAVELRNASNEFYTLIPHGFSIKRPTIIDCIDVVKAKMEMLQGLNNLQTLHGFFQGANGEKMNPMDACYDKITTDIKLLDRNAPEFAKIVEIVQKTHGTTHSHYTLQVVDVFQLKRKREDVRSRKYKNLERQMLWHGSKLINFVSILTKGLRVAPKDAPSTGYMFGKGIYFADIVSKSANYCTQHQKDNTGLLLLCDVALGQGTTATFAKSFDNIPNENEQCVKALGATYPTEYSTLDGIKVATGGLRRATFPTGLQYNEFVVYDIAQVKMKYLVKVKFCYRR